ncbi:hypothetical protein R3P38DRAFT_1549879 [Favolaschia claudopus]|uniref:Secreted protein n=1 Tax=Favolaschia claudopus TaxID=2862362 RepID=A0AAW0AJP8_9AGAR
MGNILPSVHSRRHSLLAIWMIVFGTATSTFNWPQHSRPWQREKPHHQLDCAVKSIAPPGFEFASVCTLKTSYLRTVTDDRANTGSARSLVSTQSSFSQSLK